VLQNGVRCLSRQFPHFSCHNLTSSCCCLWKFSIGIISYRLDPTQDYCLTQIICPHSVAFRDKRTNQKNLHFSTNFCFYFF
jgi:hypothetical protein